VREDGEIMPPDTAAAVAAQNNPQALEIPQGLGRGSRPPLGWWPVAHSEEVTATPKAFRVMATELAAYRDRSGAVRAAINQCPHRRVPFTLGWVTDDGLLQCGYHGWCFDGATGRCQRIPNFGPGEKPSTRIRVPVFPVAEEDGLVYVWLDATSTAQYRPPQETPRRLGGFRNQIVVRAPYERVAEVLALNPIWALGLGWIVAAGEEVGSCRIDGDADMLTVHRHRSAVGTRRVRTFDSPLSRFSHRLSRSSTTIDVLTGQACVIADGLGGAQVRVVAGLCPTDSYMTTVRWRCTISGPTKIREIIMGYLTALTRRPAAGMTYHLHRAVDETRFSIDPAVLSLRQRRARRGGSTIQSFTSPSVP
jgi:nitrite reductase/ring-hydroxylating ferredoxin subunit